MPKKPIHRALLILCWSYPVLLIAIKLFMPVIIEMMVFAFPPCLLIFGLVVPGTIVYVLLVSRFWGAVCLSWRMVFLSAAWVTWLTVTFWWMMLDYIAAA
jgi:hypothetical protein